MATAPNKLDLARLRAAVRQATHAVLAPASGGCAQYIFSVEVGLHWLPRGQIALLMPPRTDNQLRILRQTSLSLRIPIEVEPDGTERNQLVLTGQLVQDQRDPGYRVDFQIDRVHLQDISGAITSLAVEDLTA